MNDRLFPLALFGVGVALALDGSFWGVSLAACGLVWLILLLPRWQRPILKRMKEHEQSAKEGFARCLECYFPAQHFSFKSFDAITVSFIEMDRFLCEIRGPNMLIAYGVVDFIITESSQRLAVVHASAGNTAVVVGFDIAETERYWAKENTQFTLSTSLPPDPSETWERP